MRLASFDISARFQSPAAKTGAEAAFGLFCAIVMVALRAMLDTVADGAGPFAMVYPTVLIATLFGHWRGGLVAYLFSFFYAWWYVLPYSGSFEFALAKDATRVAINAICVAVIAILAESFRSAVQRATETRDAEIARRGMLMAELEHRTKNNFALIVSLLDIQRRRTSDAAVAQAIEQASGRVHTFARAYANLVDSQGEGSSVEMDVYLPEVVRRVTEGAFLDNVRVETRIDPCTLSRQVAVGIGLFVNEALTNCAKYAFPDGRGGSIEVSFACQGEGAWIATVRDDGVGEAAETAPASAAGGMGSGLMVAFARQAGATFEAVSQDVGHCVTVASHR
ncbi:sensor histidine kinase [Croceicoccus sp. BE223]|uniref:sensor histidine kinase n=1 Tax=Croceicoccus sp. BE223 TaxID=2817716 RepID=UPI00285EEE69|nr:sensor histidine kinase [Croceicoccus sp. BE223]MDR7101081.1 two-component sensor histidine kinase [Croceicoccus sp. BE223]